MEGIKKRTTKTNVEGGRIRESKESGVTTEARGWSDTRKLHEPGDC